MDGGRRDSMPLEPISFNLAVADKHSGAVTELVDIDLMLEGEMNLSGEYECAPTVTLALGYQRRGFNYEQ